MLQKIFRTKLWKGFCCVLLAGVIYYFMTDGFSQTVGQTARVGKDAQAVGTAGGFPAEYVVIGMLAVWCLLMLGRYLWERHSSRPKNDVNVRY